MAAAIHWKFRSATDRNTLNFDGPGLRVFDVKAAIVQKKGMDKGLDNFDLEVANEQTREVYLDETMLIPKNTSVIIKRLPKPGQVNLLARLANNAPFSAAMMASMGGPQSIVVRARDSSAAPAPVKPPSSSAAAPPAKPSATTPAPPSTTTTTAPTPKEGGGGGEGAVEEKKGGASLSSADELMQLDRAIEEASAYGGNKGPAWMASKPLSFHHPGAGPRPVMGGRGMAPGQRFMLGGRGGMGGGVTCHKCGKEGHIVRNCPALNNPDFKKDPMKNTFTGLPKSQIQAISEEEAKEGDVIGGKVVVKVGTGLGIIQSSGTTLEQIKRHGGQSFSLDKLRGSASVPETLKCPLCHRLMDDAAQVLSCQKSGCDKCVRRRLQETNFRCPFGDRCQRGKNHPVRQDEVHPIGPLRDMVSEWLRQAMAQAQAAGGVPDASLNALLGRSATPTQGGKPPSPSVGPVSKDADAVFELGGGEEDDDDTQDHTQQGEDEATQGSTQDASQAMDVSESAVKEGQEAAPPSQDTEPPPSDTDPPKPHGLGSLDTNGTLSSPAMPSASPPSHPNPPPQGMSKRQQRREAERMAAMMREREGGMPPRGMMGMGRGPPPRGMMGGMGPPFDGPGGWMDERFMGPGMGMGMGMGGPMELHGPMGAPPFLHDGPPPYLLPPPLGPHGDPFMHGPPFGGPRGPHPFDGPPLLMGPGLPPPVLVHVPSLPFPVHLDPETLLPFNPDGMPLTRHEFEEWKAFEFGHPHSHRGPPQGRRRGGAHLMGPRQGGRDMGRAADGMGWQRTGGRSRSRSRERDDKRSRSRERERERSRSRERPKERDRDSKKKDKDRDKDKDSKSRSSKTRTHDESERDKNKDKDKERWSKHRGEDEGSSKEEKKKRKEDSEERRKADKEADKARKKEEERLRKREKEREERDAEKERERQAAKDREKERRRQQEEEEDERRRRQAQEDEHRRRRKEEQEAQEQEEEEERRRAKKRSRADSRDESPVKKSKKNKKHSRSSSRATKHSEGTSTRRTKRVDMDEQGFTVTITNDTPQHRRGGLGSLAVIPSHSQDHSGSGSSGKPSHKRAQRGGQGAGAGGEVYQPPHRRDASRGSR